MVFLRLQSGSFQIEFSFVNVLKEFFSHLYRFEELIRWGGYGALAAIVFAETGLLAGFFLPGDSLLVTAGLLTAVDHQMNVVFLLVLLSGAAILGDTVGYWLGYHIGPRIFNREDNLFFHKNHLLRAQKFYEKYGAKTIVLARFIPIVRTFAPTLAGVGRMSYFRFLVYNIVGGVGWVTSMILSGYFLGRSIPNIEKQVHWVVLIVILLSFLPILREWFESRKARPLLFLAVFIPFISGGCTPSPSKVVKIGCAAPMTGDQAQLGIDTCNAVRLAIEQANAQGEVIPGSQLELLALDDQHNPAQAVNVAKKFVADPDVVAVVGHFNSSCTKPASAVYHEARLPQITATSTNPELSRQGFDTFFRVSATDDVQGPAGTRFAMKKLGVKNVFIIDDKTTYGKGLADEFEKAAREKGLAVFGHEGITQGDKDFSPLLTKIKPLSPDLIYFGGVFPEGALLLRQGRGLGVNSIFLGGDGLANPLLIQLATASIAEGTYATMVGGDMHQVPSAAPFIHDYESRYGAVGQWSAYGYDSANILIAAIRKAGVKNREAVLKALRQIPRFQGVTGEVVFDSKGDNQNQFIGIFQVQGGQFVYIGAAD